MTPSEEIIQRHARTEYETDSFGRRIGVRRLKVSQETRVSEWTPGLDGETKVIIPANPETGEPATEVSVSRRAQMLIVASVCEIDGQLRPFPRNRGELDSLADALAMEGIVAAAAAYTKFNPKRDEDGEGESAIDQAKK